MLAIKFRSRQAPLCSRSSPALRVAPNNRPNECELARSSVFAEAALCMHHPQIKQIKQTDKQMWQIGVGQRRTTLQRSNHQTEKARDARSRVTEAAAEAPPAVLVRPAAQNCPYPRHW
jgi:hypothetical protein